MQDDPTRNPTAPSGPAPAGPAPWPEADLALGSLLARLADGRDEATRHWCRSLSHTVHVNTIELPLMRRGSIAPLLVVDPALIDLGAACDDRSGLERSDPDLVEAYWVNPLPWRPYPVPAVPGTPGALALALAILFAASVTEHYPRTADLRLRPNEAAPPNPVDGVVVRPWQTLVVPSLVVTMAHVLPPEPVSIRRRARIVTVLMPPCDDRAAVADRAREAAETARTHMETMTQV